MSRSRRLAVLTVTVTLLVPTATAVAHETGHHTEVALLWHGDAGQQTLTGSVLGDLTVVPGDRGERIIAVRNDGPSGGTLSVSIVGARLDGPTAAFDAGLADDLRVNGIPVARLLGTDTVIHHAPVARGDVVEVPLSHEFLPDATTGNRGEAEVGTLAFDVQLWITGERATTGDDMSGPVVDGAVDGPLAHTGGQAAADLRWLVTGAGALLVVAALVARWRYRSRDGR